MTSDDPYDHTHALIPPDSPRFWLFAAIALTVSSFGGLMQGLSVGCFSLTEAELRAYASRWPSSRGRIATIRHMLRKQNLLLSTLVFANTAANMSLPIFLDPIASPAVTLVLSVTLVLIMGEILPQSICIGPRRVPIITFFTPLIWVLLRISYPVAKPIALALDRLVGTTADDLAEAAKNFRSGGARAIARAHTFQGGLGRGTRWTIGPSPSRKTCTEQDLSGFSTPSRSSAPSPLGSATPTLTNQRAAAPPSTPPLSGSLLDRAIRQHMALGDDQHYRLQIVPYDAATTSASSASSVEISSPALANATSASSATASSRAQEAPADRSAAAAPANAAERVTPAGNSDIRRRGS